MRNLILGILVVLFLLLFNSMYVYKQNEEFLENYEKEEYIVNDNGLLPINIFQSYITYYNNGNIYYKKSNFKQAISEYEEALNKNPNHPDACQIRINLALSIVYQLNMYSNFESIINTNIEQLNRAIDILCEEGCAHRYDIDGHNIEAQILKLELECLLIEEEMKKENLQENIEEQLSEEELEEKLKQIEENAYEEKNEYIQYYENFYKTENNSGKNW